MRWTPNALNSQCVDVDVDIFKLSAHAQSIYREVYDMDYIVTTSNTPKVGHSPCNVFEFYDARWRLI